MLKYLREYKPIATASVPERAEKLCGQVRYEFLPHWKGANVALLTSDDPRRLACIENNIVVGFGENKTAAAHVDSNYGESELKEIVEKLVGHVGKGTFVVAGMSTRVTSAVDARARLYENIERALAAHGFALHDSNVSRLGDTTNWVVVDPKRQRLHVLPAREE